MVPLLDDVTVAEKVTDWSTVEDVGDEVSPTVVPDEPTVCVNTAETGLELKLASVEVKTAVMLCGPEVGNI